MTPAEAGRIENTQELAAQTLRRLEKRKQLIVRANRKRQVLNWTTLWLAIVMLVVILTGAWKASAFIMPMLIGSLAVLGWIEMSHRALSDRIDAVVALLEDQGLLKTDSDSN